MIFSFSTRLWSEGKDDVSDEDLLIETLDQGIDKKLTEPLK